MTVVIVGGTGFVGLNLAERLLAAGHRVVLFDRAAPPADAEAALAALPGAMEAVVGDVRDAAAVESALRPGTEAVVLAAAITADAARDASDPEAILSVNLLSSVGILRRARELGIRRIVNVGSVAALGRTAFRAAPLREDDLADPETLYAVTKSASERTLARLAALWGLDAVSVRLSTVFGPWERGTGMRDTLSPLWQILAHARAGRPAILPRPGSRDWVYAPDVADALLAILAAPTLRHPMYNVTSPHVWSALAWGEALAAAWPGFACRLAAPGETPNVDLHAVADRAPLDGSRLNQDLGWRARFDLAGSVRDTLARERAAGAAGA